MSRRPGTASQHCCRAPGCRCGSWWCWSSAPQQPSRATPTCKRIHFSNQFEEIWISNLKPGFEIEHLHLKIFLMQSIPGRSARIPGAGGDDAAAADVRGSRKQSSTPRAEQPCSTCGQKASWQSTCLDFSRAAASEFSFGYLWYILNGLLQPSNEHCGVILWQHYGSFPGTAVENGWHEHGGKLQQIWQSLRVHWWRILQWKWWWGHHGPAPLHEMLRGYCSHWYVFLWRWLFADEDICFLWTLMHKLFQDAAGSRAQCEDEEALWWEEGSTEKGWWSKVWLGG